jgi:hypothetical protein
MREIANIENVTTSATLTATGSWTLSGGFSTTCDEIVIRQITYSSQSASANYAISQILSNISSQVIGSVVNALQAHPCPGTRIKLRAPLPPQLQFQMIRSGAPTSLCNGDFISIDMDFITYRK